MSGSAISTARIQLKLILKTLLSLPGYLMPRQRPLVRVLFYHRVNSYPFQQLGPVSRELTVTPEAFAWQLGHLSEMGYRVIGLADFEQLIAGKRPADPKSVLITFDDGYEDNLLYAAPLLRSARCPAVVFAVADLIGKCTADVWPDADPPKLGKFLSEEQLLALETEGITIASHTSTHPMLTHLPPDELDRELTGSRDRLAAILGHPVTALAYPGGDYDERVERAAKSAGYSTGFTTETGPVSNGFRALALRRTEVSASDSRFVFRMKMAGALDWLALKDGASFRGLVAAANRVLLPFMRARP